MVCGSIRVARNRGGNWERTLEDVREERIESALKA